MITQTAFHLDCHPIIPECRFDCPKCIQEIKTTLSKMDGVSEVHVEEGAEGKVIVKYEPTIATVEQLIEALKIPPSFYEGFFIPTVTTS